MARASTQTLMSLDTFAKVLSINPVHFNGADGGSTFPLSGACSDVWPQYTWQTADEIIGREELAQAIHDAKIDIANVLGYSVAPAWVAQEVHTYPRFYRPEYLATDGRDNRGMRKGVSTNWAKVISPGRRATTAIEAGATVTYSDPDGDGWSELATITASDIDRCQRNQNLFCRQKCSAGVGDSPCSQCVDQWRHRDDNGECVAIYRS